MPEGLGNDFPLMGAELVFTQSHGAAKWEMSKKNSRIKKKNPLLNSGSQEKLNMLTKGKCAERPAFLLCAGSIAEFLGSFWILQELIYFLETTNSWQPDLAASNLLASPLGSEGAPARRH